MDVARDGAKARRGGGRAWAAAACLAAMAMLAGRAAADGAFQPDLGMAPELIDGGKLVDVTIPPGSAELLAHPVKAEPLQALLTEVPGMPFRPASVPPMTHAWWKYPFYAGLGLPRDLADGFFGLLAYVPVMNIVDYAAYEIVPTQAFLRDPRDWHYWTGNQNRKRHGFYDGNAWGFFPTWNAWTFATPSPKKATSNEAYNEKLRRRLQELNQAIEQRNHAVTARKLEARGEALRAVEQGDGGEAVRRMIPYFMAYPLDAEGAFALLATGLALYVPEGPSWTAPMLWKRLSDAQPVPLQQAEDMMASVAERAPDAPILNEALIYTALLRGEEGKAEATTEACLKRKPADPRLRRLALETALTAHDADKARQAYKALDLGQLPTWDREVLAARMDLFEGRIDPAQRRLAQLQAATPENACLNYCLGCAELLQVEKHPASLGGYQATFKHLEQAAFQAEHPALRQRASEALAYARSLMAATVNETAPPAAAAPESPAPESAAPSTAPFDSDNESQPDTARRDTEGE
jgi:hypothetical protein